jgi:hypothetical protein
MELTEKEAEIIRNFMWVFRYSFAAYLREAPRPSQDMPYSRRMTEEEADQIWMKLYGVPRRP